MQRKEQLNINLENHPGLKAQVKKYCDRNRIKISDFAADAFRRSMIEEEGGEVGKLRNEVESMYQELCHLRARVGKVEKFFGG